MVNKTTRWVTLRFMGNDKILWETTKKKFSMILWETTFFVGNSTIVVVNDFTF